MSSNVVLALGLGWFCGCALPSPQPRRAVFDETEYAPYAGEGSCAIEGQAFLKTRAGDVKYGAGNDVWLNPVTTYSREWFERNVIGHEALEPADPRVERYARKTVADGEGRFRFEKLPPGEYYIACWIVWEYVEAGMNTAFLMPTGGAAHTQVKVREGETVKVVVTR